MTDVVAIAQRIQSESKSLQAVRSALQTVIVGQARKTVTKTANDYAERLREDVETVWNEITRRLQMIHQFFHGFQIGGHPESKILPLAGPAAIITAQHPHP